jgi:hypothetical protein
MHRRPNSSSILGKVLREIVGLRVAETMEKVRSVAEQRSRSLLNDARALARGGMFVLEAKRVTNSGKFGLTSLK